MSDYKILRLYLKQHEDFIRSLGTTPEHLLKLVRKQLLDPKSILRRAEKQYAKYVKKQRELMNLENEINNYNIDDINNELNKEIDNTYDEIVTQ